MFTYLIRNQQDGDDAEAKLFSNPQVKLGTCASLVANTTVDLMID